MARSFFNGKLWQGILTRLGILETQQGTVPPAEDYNTVADVRALASHTEGDRVFCLENYIIYIFDASSTATDNGTTVLKPDDITAGNPGRWIQEMQLAAKTHTHTEYGLKVATPVQTRFLQSNSSGDPIEGAYDSSSFSAAGHTHSGYALAADLDEVSDDLATLSGIVTTKADKYAVQAGDIGKPAVFDADGNTVPGSTIKFFTFLTGALVAGTTKEVRHDQDMAIGYIINVREADDSNNTNVSILKPNAAEPNNVIDIRANEDIAAPGLLIQILGA